MGVIYITSYAYTYIYIHTPITKDRSFIRWVRDLSGSKGRKGAHTKLQKPLGEMYIMAGCVWFGLV